MSSVDDQSLAALVRSFRSVAMAGDRTAFAEIFLQAERLAADIRSSDEAFAHSWKDVLRFDLEYADASSFGNDLLRVEAKLPPHVIDFARRFIAKHADLLEATKHCILSLAKGSVPQIDSDICIGSWLRLLTATGDTESAKVIWATTVETTIALASEKRLSCFLLPDYIEPLITRRLKRFLSFHTAYDEADVVHFKPADLPYKVIVDEGGYSGWSTLARADLTSLALPSALVAKRFFEEHRRDILSANLSKYAQRKPLETSGLPDDYIFVALQMANDKTQLLARVPMLDMLDIVVRRFRGSATRVVVKRHPKCKDDAVGRRLQALVHDGEIVLSDSSIHSLIGGCRAVCTVNSGVGSESMIHLKPVYLFGMADYNCIAYRIGSEAEFVAATQEISLPCSQTDLQRFLYYYRNVYQTRVTDGAALRAVLNEKVFEARSP